MRTAMYVARALLIAVVVVGFALTSWAAPTPADKGTFATLSAGDQKVVRALFEAQTKGGATQPLTLDQIAAMKPGRGAGWGDVFKAMKKQGLLSQKSLGEVVTSYERAHPEVASKPGKPAKPAEKPKL